MNAKGVLPFSHPLATGGSASAETRCGPPSRTPTWCWPSARNWAETDYDFFFTGPVETGGRLIRIDIDPLQLGRNLRPDLAICSDAREALGALNATLAPFPQGTRDGAARTQAIRDGVAATRHPGYADFFAALREALPEVIIAGDSTQPTYFAWIYYETEAPRRYFHSASGFGTLGYAIPAAIGAKLGAPDNPVVGLIGDGASQFTIGELASAVESQLPVIFLVWNNTGYGEIARFMEEGGIQRIGVDIYTPNFETLAGGFGCTYGRAGDLEQLKAELRAAAERNGPTVIEVMQQDFAEGPPMP